MNIEPAPLRHVLSLLFSIYFVLNPSKAEDVCRRFRAQATVKQLRLSWEKGHINPILRGVRWLTAPDVKIVKEIMLPRPVPASPSAFDGTPGAIRTILYFDGDAAELKRSDGLILHFPGGGFCSMPPEVHEDYLRLWTKDTGWDYSTWSFVLTIRSGRLTPREHPQTPRALNRLRQSTRVPIPMGARRMLRRLPHHCRIQRRSDRDGWLVRRARGWTQEEAKTYKDCCCGG